MTKKGREKIKENHDIIFTPSTQTLDPNQASKKQREEDKNKGLERERESVSEDIEDSIVHIAGHRMKTFLSLKGAVHARTVMSQD